MTDLGSRGLVDHIVKTRRISLHLKRNFSLGNFGEVISEIKGTGIPLV